MGIKTKEPIRNKTRYGEIPVGGLFVYAGATFIKTNDVTAFGKYCSVNIKTGNVYHYSDNLGVVAVKAVNELEVEEI